mmetsp:Transcript_9212/g.17925  ORF Transcript_9212/g.17925 Transcript_9212/m.17925 type:complete len:269 (+) Transcript_9212:80-886(+)
MPKANEFPWFFAVGAELFGTFLFEFMAGASVFSSIHTGLVTASLGIGLSLLVVSYLTVGVSGAHLNPAITLVVYLSGKRSGSEGGIWLSWWLALWYMAAQIVGAILGAWLLVAIMPYEATLDSEGTSLTFLAEGELTWAHGFSVFIMEMVCTAGLTWTFFALEIDESHKAHSFGPTVMGIAMIVGVLAAGPATGASLNPARTIGPAVAYGSFRHMVAPLLGTFAGALLGGLGYCALFLFKHEQVPDLYRITASPGEHEAGKFQDSRFV